MQHNLEADQKLMRERQVRAAERNQDSYESLIAKYGSADKIPDETLYLYISRPDVRGTLRNLVSLGLDKVPLSCEVRRRSRSDLFWLSRYFLWGTNPAGIDKPLEENRITSEEHRFICDFFVKKDFAKTVADQDFFKNRLLLFPRGGMKSTIDVCDVAQWILNFPDIRVLFLTGADDLATGFVDELKG